MIFSRRVEVVRVAAGVVPQLPDQLPLQPKVRRVRAGEDNFPLHGRSLASINGHPHMNIAQRPNMWTELAMAIVI